MTLRHVINSFIFLGIIWFAIPACCVYLTSSNQTVLLLWLLEANAFIALGWWTNRK